MSSITVGGASAEPLEEEDDDTVKPLPDRLIIPAA
jgi:ParB family transcriptional regulator, chromosome partitioning protein